MDQEDFSAELLQLYYDRFFPYDLMTKWLSYGKGEDYLFRRELSFTLENDTYIRYKAFRTADEMKSSMCKTLPFKIDIGAVFSVSPADKGKVNTNKFTADERELIFDIDLTDYDDIRTCCEGASICHRCWNLMIAAVKVLETALREDFGFQHLLWVYSGRRGIHCWVADETGRFLTNEARSGLIQYLSLVEGNENSKHKVQLRDPMHPSLDRAYQLLQPLFESFVLAQDGLDIFAHEKQWKAVLDMVPDDDLRTEMTRKWSSVEASNHSPLEKWQDLVNNVNNIIRKAVPNAKRSAPGGDQRKRNLAGLKNCIPAIVLYFLYPRLDANVSKQRNHLLKAPFAIHPKTGRVCVPINAAEIENFDPFAVPTVGKMQLELDSKLNATSKSLGTDAQEDVDMNDPALTKKEKKMDGYESDLLIPYLKFFEQSFLKPQIKVWMAENREENEIRAAVTGDW